MIFCTCYMSFAEFRFSELRLCIYKDKKRLKIASDGHVFQIPDPAHIKMSGCQMEWSEPSALNHS